MDFSWISFVVIYATAWGFTAPVITDSVERLQEINGLPPELAEGQVSFEAVPNNKLTRHLSKNGIIVALSVILAPVIVIPCWLISLLGWLVIDGLIGLGAVLTGTSSSAKEPRGK